MAEYMLQHREGKARADSPFTRSNLRSTLHAKGWTDEKKATWYKALARVRRSKMIKRWHDQDGKCCYCRRPCVIAPVGNTKALKADNATLEHLVRVNDGGTDHIDNLAMACSKCNKKRDDTDFKMYELVCSDPEKREEFFMERQMAKKRTLSKRQIDRRSAKFAKKVAKYTMLFMVSEAWSQAVSQMIENKEIEDGNQ